jgi:hypothetical protein
MGGLIERLIADIVIDRAVAEKAGGIILDFPAEEGPPDNAQPFLAKLPGAQVQQAASKDGGGVGSVLGAATRMMGAGSSIGQVLSVARQFITCPCSKVDEDEGGEFVAAIPAQFV